MKRILIADDDLELVQLLSLRCTHLGFEAISATNAMEALRLIDDAKPDLVILDVEMPLGNGLSVCEMMSSHERLLAIPVIILTGRQDEETIRRCHQLCAYYVLKCPDIWSRVEPILQEALGSEPVTAGD